MELDKTKDKIFLAVAIAPYVLLVMGILCLCIGAILNKVSLMIVGGILGIGWVVGVLIYMEHLNNLRTGR